ncbi:MAG: dephospho-CoA kinase [Alistipes sp.]|nr:dephospho-CoA kinase [Alistipes sp.]
MYKVGITGGIGSGKSTVCELLATYGIAIYDSDARAKALMNDNEALREALCEAFGAECYVDGALNRQYLAAQVFGSEEKLAQLNAIVHPAVRADFRTWAENQSGDYVVLESAILFEAAFDNEVDTTIAVLAPLEERVRRASARDGVDRDAILRRIEHQMNDDELHARAARCLVNLRREYLESDVEQMHKMLLYEARR